MAPKITKPALIEDMETASFSFRCETGHEFSKTGLIFGCPRCGIGGSTFVHSEEQVQQLFNDRINWLHGLVDQGFVSIAPGERLRK